MKAEFNDCSSETVRTAEHPRTKDILILPLLVSSSMFDVARAAALYLTDAYSDRTICIAYDHGDTLIEFKPEDRAPDMSAVDVYLALMNARNQDHPTLFSRWEEEDGKLRARFANYLNDWPDFTQIYNAALDAAALSRRNGNLPVVFDFNGRDIVITATTRPENVEYVFPPAQRKRTGPEPG